MSVEDDDRRSKPPLAAGTVVADRFRIDRKIGEGGMGTVYAATNAATERPVALKIMHPEYAWKKDVVRRFMREAKAATVIKHPNVIEVFDVVKGDSGEPIMVMELLEGEPLDAVLERQGALPIADVARIMVPVVSAVGAAHARGIVHRDLKPENIHLAAEPDGTVTPKVLDFGIAKVLDPTQINELTTKGGATRTGSMLGTPHYMSLEQACGEKDIDHRSDVWSVGVLLYVMLTGRRPFQGDNYGQILKALMTDTPTPVGELVPDLPADIASVIDRCMHRARTDRPQDLREVFGVLARYTNEIDAQMPPLISGTLPGVGDIGTRPTLQAASVYTSKAPSSSVPGRSRRGLLAIVAVAGISLPLAALAIWKLTMAPAPAVFAAPDPPVSDSAMISATASAPQPVVSVVEPDPSVEPVHPAASVSAPTPAKTASPNRPKPTTRPTATATEAPPATTPTNTKGGIIEKLPY